MNLGLKQSLCMKVKKTYKADSDSTNVQWRICTVAYKTNM